MAATRNKQQGIRVLLVDDEKSFVDVLAKRMNHRGFHVTTSNTGDDAVQILRKNDFDMVVLDLKMEGMDGIEVLKIFKKMVPDLPIIMLTGHGSRIAAEDGKKYGVLDYIAKPYDFDSLVQKIQAALNGRQREGDEE